jgi:NhaP-type Na+/H+ or K+/H+ antiporter
MGEWTSLDYGKAKRLRILLGGEAVINNSLAIVLFKATKTFAIDDRSRNRT